MAPEMIMRPMMEFLYEVVISDIGMGYDLLF